MIPDFQSIMLPLLKQLSDKKEHHYRDLTEILAEEFKLTEDERKELLPSGQQPLFDNRVGWARTYLKKAGLISSPSRGISKITQKGIDVLSQNPSKINLAYLMGSSTSESSSNKVNFDSAEIDNTETPEEHLDKAYDRIRKTLASELLNKVIELSPTFFERLVVELLVKMGYGGSFKDAGRAMGKTGDEGIDGTIKEDKLGLDIIYIQAKRWKPGNVVGRPEIQKFVGALAGQGAKKGIFITTSTFSKDALEYTPRNETKIVLIDGELLTQLMIDHNLGCTTQQTYELKRIDSDYFGEE